MDGTLVFADHVEAQKFGEHTRELRFPELIALQSIKVLRRNEKMPIGTAGEFEGRTYPDVRAIQLEVFAADVMAANSTMLALQSSSLVTYDVPGQLVTNSIVVRGKFIKVSIAIYGHVLPSETAIPQPLIAQHLRPSSTFEDKLDMADLDGDEDMKDRRDVMKETNFELDDLDRDDFDASAPSFVRALGFGVVQEANARLTDHAAWLAALHTTSDVVQSDGSVGVLDAEVVGRLEALSQDIVTLAQRAPENAAHVQLGPDLARSLLCLISRCRERFEFRPLRAALQALATCLISATAAAELLSKGLDVVVSILKEAQEAEESLKLASLQVLLQLSSHVTGMEALLGWSDAPSSPTAYEVVLSLALDGMPGQPRSEFVALTLLRRAGLYEAMARFDDCCSKLEAVESSDAPQDKLQRLAAEALQDIATLMEHLSQPLTGRDLQSPFFLLEDDLVNGLLSESKLPSVIFGGSGTGPAASDPFTQGQNHLYGFLESFLTGRRILPGLNVLLRRLQRMPPEERLLVFHPFQRLICTLLSCTGGPQFLAADNSTISTMLRILQSTQVDNGRKLPAVPRFPATLVRDLGGPQLAALVGLHIKAFRLSIQLVMSTRSNGWGGLLPEEHAFSVLAALHRLCVRGSAGRCAVVYAFRSVFFTEWLMKQIDGRLDEALPGGSGRYSQVQPSLRHLVAILHALVLSDLSGAAADRFGDRILALANKAIRVLEPQAESAEGDASASLLEFALDSEGAEGGLGKAVRMGRRSADLETLKNLKELAAQLRPWRPEEESGSLGPMKDAKLMSSLILSKGARSLKRSANEERGSRRMALVLGGHAGATNGVEIPEVDFKASESVEHGDLPIVADDHERFPTDDLTELPLVAIRVLCRRAAAGSKEAMAIVLHDEEGMKSKDGLAQLVPWLIRCAGALNLNLEATILREDKKPVASIYATRRAHLQLLEAALPTCVHLLSGLRDTGLPHYRHTELCQTVLLLAQRLTSGLPGLAPRTSFSSDPEFRLLWRHCVVWLCRLFRLWFQGFPQAAGGQLLLPLLRHARVLPTNFSGGIMLLATCGTLKPVLPKAACHFSLKFTNAPASNGDGLQSRAVLLPTSTRTGNHAVVSLSHVSNGSDGAGSFGQFHHSEVQDWEGNGATTDPLVQALAQEREAATAQALGLVELVNSRRERLSLDDVGELLALVAESALTSDAFLHLCTAKVMEKLTVAGLPVLQIIQRLAEAALNGVMMETEGREGREGDDISGGAARDQRDARAVSRLLLLLGHFGALSTSARLALTEHSVETLCQSVLAHTPATSLPPMAFSQSIRLLGLMFTSTQSTPSSHSVPKCRMVAKAVNLLINKASDSHHSSSTVSAALELLVGLCTPQWLCLNLLFSGSHENEDDKVVTVTVSSAFKLEKCMQRLAQELETATQQCRSVEKGSEDEAAALEDLAGWLQAVELMISLQRVVVENCPTSTIFLEVVLENSAASPGSLFGEVLQIMQGIPRGSESQVSRIVQAVTALRKELEAKPAGPVPSELPLQIFAPPVRGKGSLEAAKNSLEDRSGYSQEDCVNAVAEVVGLLDAAADLESSAEWVSVVELDSTDVGDDTKMEWEFDAGVLRKKRQDFLEKFESDRRAKRLKQQQEKQLEKQRMEREEKTSAGAPSSQSPTDLVPKEAPRQTGQTEKPEKAEAAKKGAMDGKVNPAEALQGFLQDHPEFMRVLQNPKKCLADPRVKRMFVAELQNYPAVKSFLASQGLQL